MCGIFVALSKREPVWPSEVHQLLLTNRGPDTSGTMSCVYKVTDSTEQVFVTLYSTVLSLRGEKTIQQPFTDDSSRCHLSWNGEAWDVNGRQPHGNDTEAIFELLKTRAAGISQERNSSAQALANIAQAFAAVAGPYSFAWFDNIQGRMLFGRDFIGRRSLLRHITEDGSLIIASVSDANAQSKWDEIEADGIYCIDLQTWNNSGDFPASIVSQWGQFSVAKVDYHMDESNIHNSAIPSISLDTGLTQAATLLKARSPSVSRLEQLLRRSLSSRILTIPDPPLPSGLEHGRRCTKLAILFSGGLDCTVLARMSHDILPPGEPIDLLNVAFENPRIHAAKDGEVAVPDFYELCPDRITGRSSHAELRNLCPDREWRFVTINIPYLETTEHRRSVITLMHPHNTEMDLSIASALYFAARGAGHIVNPQAPGVSEPYTTSSRVLLSGLGADELFGGYQRHATAYNRTGISGLVDELNLDTGRLGKRNLGRDDRVISNWGREARFPYLDEHFLSWAMHAPIHEKCGFGEIAPADGVAVCDDGSHLEPGKKVLRCLAWKLGMKAVASEKKRAIQFGARTAKMQAGKTKGTNLIS